MSTIEKAAARLVKRPAQPRPTPDAPDPAANEKDSATPATQQATPPSHGLSSPSTSPVTSPAITERRDEIKTCELDFPWLKENGFLVPGHDNRQQAQEFRRIKRPLLLNLQDKVAAEHPIPTNIVFVTSALPGEGKTFVSLNLALSLASEVDRNVLLLDGDAAKGDMSRWMGIAEEPGLIDLLKDNNRRGEDAVINTNVDGLSVLGCGTVSDSLDELYGSDLMNEMLNDLASSSRSRIVVIDGPPLMATTEAAVLAQRMGQTVVVVEANKTPQSAVEQAVQQLEGSQLVSVLLNKVSGSSANSYGYGYGARDAEAMQAEK